MNKFISDIITGIDGQTTDPARIIGYGASLLIVATFLFNSIWAVIHTGHFDAQSFGIGAGGILGGVMAVGIGVAAKSKTEPQ